MSRRDRASRRAGVFGSAAAHGVLLLALVLTARKAEANPMVVYAVNLVAAPAPEQQTPTRVAPEAPPTVKEATVAVAKPKPKPPPKKAEPPKKQPDTKRTAEKPPVTRSDVKPLPGETPSTGQDPLTLRQEGKDFPYPEYLRNVVAQIYQRWDRPVGPESLKAEVWFMIMRDGSVRDIKLAHGSGNAAFDVQVLGAIERAGKAGAFGPLPSGWTDDVLPIAFSFSPREKE